MKKRCIQCGEVVEFPDDPRDENGVVAEIQRHLHKVGRKPPHKHGAEFTNVGSKFDPWKEES